MEVSELNKYEKSVISQGGEDGVVEEICRRIGLPDGAQSFFVEIGAEAHQCNCGYLYQKGWSGMFVECDIERCTALREKYTRCISSNRMATSDTINDTIHSCLTKVLPKVSLLSIDIDGNDYWVLKAILEDLCKEICPHLQYKTHEDPTSHQCDACGGYLKTDKPDGTGAVLEPREVYVDEDF